MDDVARRQNLRFSILKFIYEKTGGSEAEYVDESEIAEALAIPADEFDLASIYLRREGLVTGVSGPAIAITHAGVVEVESKLTQPNQPTKHFPGVINIANIRYMSQSQFQQGTTGSTQHGDFLKDNRQQLTALMKDIKDKLPQVQISEDDRAVANEDVATVERQLALPRPKASIVQECLKSIRNIAEGAVAGGASAAIVQGITAFLGG